MVGGMPPTRLSTIRFRPFEIARRGSRLTTQAMEGAMEGIAGDDVHKARFPDTIARGPIQGNRRAAIDAEALIRSAKEGSRARTR